MYNLVSMHNKITEKLGFMTILMQYLQKPIQLSDHKGINMLIFKPTCVIRSSSRSVVSMAQLHVGDETIPHQITCIIQVRGHLCLVKILLAFKA